MQRAPTGAGRGRGRRSGQPRAGGDDLKKARRALARDRNDVVRRYGDLYSQVLAVFARHDPVGLIALGFPDDEYEPEVVTVLRRVEAARSVDEFRALIEAVFTEWVGREMMIAGTSRAVAAEAWPMVRPHVVGPKGSRR